VRGRDGCRVPIPWVADAPSYGFGPGERSWLPQPVSWATYALDRQRGAPDSTYELFRTALRLRRELGLGGGSAEVLPDVGEDVVALTNGGVLVLANLGATPVALPDGAEPLLSSGPLDRDGRVPTDVTVWARRPARAHRKQGAGGDPEVAAGSGNPVVD
jgi:alpha-glucosidase